MSEEQKDISEITSLLEGGDTDSLRTKLMDLKSADIADIIENLEDKENRKDIFEILDGESSSEVLLLLDRDIELELIDVIPDEQLADIVEEMAPDDAADFLGEIEDKSRMQTLLKEINDEERKEILHLLSFDEESAGGIMTSEFLPFPSSMKVGTVLKMIRSITDLKDPIMYIYVVEPVTKKFLGSVSLVDLIKANSDQLIVDLIEKDYVWTTVDADQEEIAKDFRRYNLWVMPVLDDQHRLVGRITADDILDVSIEEADEDIAQMAGTPDLLDENVSPFHIIKLRLPWLLITLCLALVNSIVIESMLESANNVIALAVFLPVIMAMGGNTGMQSATIIIREMAMEKLYEGDLALIVKRESFIGFCMGVICGLCGAIISYVFMSINSVDTGNDLTKESLTIIVFLAIINAMTFSSFFGSAIPQILRKLGLDPAVAAGPFITTLNDIISSVIYFLTTYALIQWAF
ncbi:MAG: magnesium transporter [Lentisphaeraceae bacterium]|nr:magnesium transporter [Lentisphaeraceae bacterium]